MSHFPYASVIGSLMYAMVCTRPDISFAVSVVIRFMGQSRKEHWKTVKQILRYLNGTKDVRLVYSGDRDCIVAGYYDSNYAGDVDSCRSMTSMEAEYIALTKAAKEGISLKGLISDLGIKQDQATIYYDSLSALRLAKDQIHHSRIKHIDVRYHFIRSKSRISLKKVHTKDNPADMLTKEVTKGKFNHCMDLLNIYIIEHSP